MITTQKNIPMKTLKTIILLTLIIFQVNIYSQTKDITDDENGDWTEQYVTLYNTPEADIMVRSGDIDNLGFGWPTNFDPFSGQSTPAHGFPWALDPTDASGTDRIMVVTSYNGTPSGWQDGYTSRTSRPENLPRPIVLNYDLNDMALESAIIQVFSDDFQAPNTGAVYFTSINGVDMPNFAEVINPLTQGGPIGKIITVSVPQEQLYLLESDSLSILFDDTITGAGDGYAIDFVKLLLNPKGFAYTAKVYGFVTDEWTSEPIENVRMTTSSGTSEVFTDEDGYYYFDAIPAGITQLHATTFSYDTASILIDLEVNDSIRYDLFLNIILDAEFEADVPMANSIPHTVHFADQTSLNPTQWLWDFGDGNTSDEQNPIHTYTNTGYYTVTLTASNDDESNTEVKEHYIQISVTGIDDYKKNSDLVISPNPITNRAYITLEINENNQHFFVELYNLQGVSIKSIQKQAFKQGKQSFEIDVDDLGSGIYFLELKMKDLRVIKKMIISN